MSFNTIILLQSVLISLQMINSTLEQSPAIHFNPVWNVVGAAVIGGMQFYIQHVGNVKDPNTK